ncbi:3093_t:CDS:2 [Dentiscutata erythropus]|uniref:3093_t:CDS:1 n=1 Tax=Dentiscutata erythropus TaxID=1348616 RepID=A0A9N9H106_9GLOM|nr:3093_t:CDS:2 [Dentiscutata erythropus]
MPKVNSNNSTRVKRRQSICTSSPSFRPSPDDKTTAEILAGLTAEHIPLPDTHFIKRVLENSRRAKSKKNDPPRPPNAFFLFRNALHIHLSTHNLKVPQVSMAAGKLWDNATEKTKSQYTRLQEIAKVLHLEMHPGYVYRPRKSLQDKKEDDQRQHQINNNSLISVQYSQDINLQQRQLQQRQLQQRQLQHQQQCISNSNAIGQPSIFNNTLQIIDPTLITTTAPTLASTPNFNLFNDSSNGNNGFVSGLGIQDMSNLMSFGLCEQDDGTFNEWINWDIKL